MNDSDARTTSSDGRKSALPAIFGYRWTVGLVGSGVCLGLAVIGLQYLRPVEGKAQTRPAASSTAASSGANNTTSEVYARVNNVPITYDALARVCVDRHGVAVLDNLINQMIIQQECTRRGLSVSQAEIEQEVANTAKKFNLPLDTWYKMLESERGLNRQQYHNDVIWPMLALKKLAGENVQVTEQDMQLGFERDYGPRMKGRMIMIDGNSRQAADIWQKCQKNPDDFERLAREHSSDPNTRPLGGVIPPIQRHAGNPQIEAAAFKLREGEISALIQVAESRYVILMCEGFTEPVVQDIKVVWNDLYNSLVEEKVQVSVAKVFTEIKEKAVVQNFLTRTVSGPQVSPAAGQDPSRTSVVPAGSIRR